MLGSGTVSAIFRTRHPVTGALVDDTTFFDSQTAKKKIAAFKRQLSRRFHKSSIKTREYYLQGGPFDGQFLRVESTGTLPFTANNMHGYYNLNMRWVSLEK